MGLIRPPRIAYTRPWPNAKLHNLSQINEPTTRNDQCFFCVIAPRSFASLGHYLEVVAHKVSNNIRASKVCQAAALHKTPWFLLFLLLHLLKTMHVYKAFIREQYLLAFIRKNTISIKHPGTILPKILKTLGYKILLKI